MSKRLATYYLPILVLLCSIIHTQAYANAIVFTSLNFDQGTQTVTTTFQWQNSWRVSTQMPRNWDAVWVFVKFRACGADSTVQWTHGIVSLASPTVIDPYLQATQKDGTPDLLDSDSLGYMLRQSTDTIAPIAGPYNCTFFITNLPTTGAIDVKIFGIETVFIPQEAFYVGDGNSMRAWNTAQITSENAIALVNSDGAAYDMTATAAYPKGYNAFYCMKYEISQGQYAEFLNTIPYSAGVAHYLYNNGTFNSYRNTLRNDGVAPKTYWAVVIDRAQNYLGFDDFSAYLDWSALRPMTELEYEKVCRGLGVVVVDEYAWGNTLIIEGRTLSGNEDGTQTVTEPNANVNYINNAMINGDGGNGPIRVGIYAASLPNSTRPETGAGYYGNMEMSGNVREYVIPLSTYSTVTLPFLGTLGDGYLGADDQHDVADWPVYVGGLSVSYNMAIGSKGGGWDNTWGEIRLSDRYYCGYTSMVNDGRAGGSSTEGYQVGGRGVR